LRSPCAPAGKLLAIDEADVSTSTVIPVEVDEYVRIAAAEDEHWWYRNTRALAQDLLGPWLDQHPRILDAGCGPGGNGASFTAHGSVIGIDISPDALTYVRVRRPQMVPVRASIEALPFVTGVFDIALVLTVLHTVTDDARAVSELARVVRSGGAVLLVEPAFESLGRAHDATVHGQRRYRRRALTELVVGAGLQVAHDHLAALRRGGDAGDECHVTVS